MINKELVIRKLVKLKEYLEELRPLTQYTFSEYQQNNLVKRSSERILMLVVEVASDINSHFCVKLFKKPPTSYFDSFLMMGELKILDDAFAKRLAQSAGLRNRLIHEYEDIDDETVHSLLTEAINDYTKYIEIVKNFINKA